MAVEEPLRRVVAVWLGQAVRVFLGGDLLPVGEVEGDFNNYRCRNSQILINLPHFFFKLRVSNK